MTTPDEIPALDKDAWQKYDETLFYGVHYHFYPKPKRLCGLRSEMQEQVHKSENTVDKFLCAA